MQSNPQYVVRIKEGVPTRTEELHRVRQIVEDEAVGFGFDRETAFRMALAVDEACTNIIKHSYAGSTGQTFELEIGTIGDRFVIVLTDHGKSFDPGKLPKLDMKRYFEQCLRGGLGVHIIKLVMDDVVYNVTTNHTNQLRLVKYLSA